MNDISSQSPDRTSMWSKDRPRLAALIALHILICCVSLMYIGQSYFYEKIVLFDKAQLFWAVLNVATFAPVACLFLFSRFSFGYLLGIYFYTIILGYLWFLAFSRSSYDHSLAHVSIFLSALAFLLPALLIQFPMNGRFVLSIRSFDRLIYLILVLAVTTVVISASQNFRLVGLSRMYEFRKEIEFPGYLRYMVGISSSALLPFAFACFVARGYSWRAGAVLFLLLLLYPVTLTKLTLFAPCWLLFVLLLSRFVEARIVAVLSLLLPIFSGIFSVLLAKSGLITFERMTEYFGIVNFRMVALPSIALDLYNEFFSTHPLTHFCQISLLKPLITCPYSQPLSVIMAENYTFGNLNASLFATEGIASVGLIMAPISALGCGLVIALGNRLSYGLPANFVLLSGSLLTQVFLNVPLTTTLLSNGAACLFLLWYVTPRSIFEREATGSALST
jgi:hypothetical protein